MRCHDILGIRENATAEQIEAAYSEKLEKLEAGADVLSPIANEKKRTELAGARQMCLDWLDKKGIQRIGQRIADEVIPRPNEFRTNACWFGPMTLGYNLCCVPCGLTDGGTLCIMGIGDIFIYAMLIHAYIKDRQFWDEIAEDKKRKERAEEARKAIARFESDLSRCRADQIKWQNQVRRDNQQLEYLRAYADLFAAMGAADSRNLVRHQEQILSESRSKLEELNQQEVTYCREIRQQKSKL